MVTQALASATKPKPDEWFDGPSGWSYNATKRYVRSPDGAEYDYHGKGLPTQDEFNMVVQGHAASQPKAKAGGAALGAMLGGAPRPQTEFANTELGRAFAGPAGVTPAQTPPKTQTLPEIAQKAQKGQMVGTTDDVTRSVDYIVSKYKVTEADKTKLYDAARRAGGSYYQFNKALQGIKSVPQSVKDQIRAKAVPSAGEKELESGRVEDVTMEAMSVFLPDPVFKSLKVIAPYLKSLKAKAGSVSAEEVAKVVDRATQGLSVEHKAQVVKEVQKALPRLGETTFREPGVTAVPPGGVRAPEKAALKAQEDAYVKANIKTATQKARAESMKDKSAIKPKVDPKAVEKSLREEYQKTRASMDAEAIRQEAVQNIPAKERPLLEVTPGQVSEDLKTPRGASTGNVGANSVKTEGVKGSTTPPRRVSQVSEPGATPGTSTSGQRVANASANVQRSAMGLDSLKGTKPETVQQWADAAQTKGLPGKALATATRILDDKNPFRKTRLSDEETAGMAMRLDELDQQMQLTDPKNVEELQRIAHEVDTITQATKKAGTEWGREGVARQTWFKSNYTSGGLLRRFIAEGGEPNKIATVAKNLGDDIEKGEATVTNLRAQAGLYSTRGAKIKGDIRAARADALARIRTNLGNLPSGPKIKGKQAGAINIDPDKLAAIAQDMMIVVKSYAQEGAVTLGNLLPKVRGYLQENGINVTDEHIQRILAGEYERSSKELTEQAFVLQSLRQEARRSVGAQRAMLQRKIAEQEKRIAGLSGPAPKIKTPIDKALRDEEIKLMARKVEADTIAGELRKQRLAKERHIGIKIYHETADIMRSVVASTDLSAPFNQGMFALGGHPFASAKAALDMVKALKSEAKLTELIAGLRTSKRYNEAVAAGLEVHSTRLGRGEEFFTSQLVNDLPLISHSERAYTAYLNRLRMDMFENLVNAQEGRFFGLGKAKKLSIEDLKATAEYVNTVTGVGTGDIANAMKAGNRALPLAFAPGYMVSRWKTALGTPAINALVRKNPRLATMILKDYAAFAGVVGGSLLAAKTAGLDVDTSMEKFGKIKVGNVEVDPFGSIFGPLRLLAKVKDKPNQAPISVGYYAFGKASPLARSAWDTARGENFNKEKVGFQDWEQVWNLTKGSLPIMVQQQMELSNTEGLTDDQKSALRLLTILGLNLNVKDQPAKGR